MSDDLTNLLAAAEAAGMRLPLRYERKPSYARDYAGDICNADGHSIIDLAETGLTSPEGEYLVAAANAAPGLAAEVERLKVELRCEQIRSEDRGASYVEARHALSATQAERDAARAEVERLRVSGSSSASDSPGMTINDLTIKLSLSQTREQQATEACTALTLENQRLREALALQKHLDAEIDDVLEGAEEADVEAAQLRAEVARLTQERDGLRGLIERTAQEMTAAGFSGEAERIRRDGGLTSE